MNTRICYTRKCLIALPLALAMLAAGCGKPVAVNLHPSPLDTPVEIANGIVSSVGTFEGIVKRHHVARRAAIAADPTLSNPARKAAQIAETAKFKKFNEAHKRILIHAEEAAHILQSADSGALATAQGKIKLASDIVVNELLAAFVDDPELRDSVTALESLMQKLIARQ